MAGSAREKEYRLKQKNTDIPSDSSLLLVDDNEQYSHEYSYFLQVLGFDVSVASTIAVAKRFIAIRPPAFAVTELRLPDGNGLDVLEALRSARSNSKAVVLTSFGDFATAVGAIKIGAIDYLVKPVDCHCVKAALLTGGRSRPPPPVNPVDPDRARSQHILSLYELCDYNVSETARRLSMHRRSLQRIIQREAKRRYQKLRH